MQTAMLSSESRQQELWQGREASKQGELGGEGSPDAGRDVKQAEMGRVDDNMGDHANCAYLPASVWSTVVQSPPRLARVLTKEMHMLCLISI